MIKNKLYLVLQAIVYILFDNNNKIYLFNWIMSNAQYTNVNNVKRVKLTHDDKHNTKHDGGWFIKAQKELMGERVNRRVK